MKRKIISALSLLMAVSLSIPAFASTYTVKPGDYLWKISEKELGSGDQWNKLYKANKSIIKNPDLILPGQVLTLPDDASAAAASSESKADANTTSAEIKADAASADYVIELDPQYNVPTEELLKTFPITYQTPADTDLAKKVQNRMLNGFNRWNMGYEAWEHWGEVLYHKDSIYNVHGVRLTLAEYQKSMDASLKSIDIQMGNFNNMILSGDWMAIRYDIVNTSRKTGESSKGTTMEFAKFGDYGELGAKVDEGWGGVKGADYEVMQNFQTKEEKEAQKKFMDEMIAKELPKTDDLEKKYPVLYPTPIDTEIGKKIKAAVLNEFEAWNGGYDTWAAYADKMYAADLKYDLSGEEMDLAGLKAARKDTVDQTKRVQINNILVSEDWAAIHFWDVTTGADGSKSADNHMQFLHFVEDGDSVKVDMCWAK